MSASLEFDKTYLKTVSFIIKSLCLLFSFIGFNCILFSSVSSSNLRGSFYLCVAILAFLTTLCLLLARLFQVWQKKFYEFNVVKLELYLHGCLAVAYFIASAITISLDVVSYTVATFFGLLAFSLYAYDAYLSYNLHRKCDAATQTQPLRV